MSNLHHNVQFYRFKNVLVWAVKNATKWHCGRELIHAFSMTIKTHTFENTLVWVGPNSVADLWEGHEGNTLIFTLFLGQTEAHRDEKNSFPGQALFLS